MRMNRNGRVMRRWLLSAAGLGLSAAAAMAWAEDDFFVKEAKWESGDRILVVKGKGAHRYAQVEILNAASGDSVDSTRANEGGEWKARERDPDQVPCRIRAESGGDSDERAVRNAPADCVDGGSPPVAGDLAVLVANDLGMHCADLDYTVFSILPPLNVAHIQVIKKGNGLTNPVILGPDSGVEIFYSATSAQCDPAHADPDRTDGVHECDQTVPQSDWSINTTSSNIFTLKTNFWDVVDYDDNSNLDQRSFGFDAYAPLFFGLLSPEAVNQVDLGLPIPESLLLPGCLPPPFAGGSGDCAFLQASMPGPANTPRQVLRFDHEFNFFDSLLGGLGLGAIVHDTNWWSLEGLPVLPVDDRGRSNAYPLYRLEARVNGQVAAATDLVTPVASEADCQNCHVYVGDCDAAAAGGVDIDPSLCTGAGMDRTDFTAVELDGNPPGDTLREQLLNTAKLNILSLHDAKHATDLVAQTPVQCSSCHYSPATDLAQVGPTDTPDGTASGGLDGPQLSGTSQTSHISMSRAMHFHHGGIPADPDQPFDEQDNALFPTMPGPVGRSLDTTQNVLEQTCYQCHPGKRTQCLRGAMAAGGVVCQDCHGSMLQVGDDFTEDFPSNPGSMTLTKRVPWAVEPGCQSCHVGDAMDQPADTSGFVWDDPTSPMRLLQAWRDGDTDAAPIKAPNSRFAENRITESGGETVDLLYRLSAGHGGVMCEGCHGSTHAIFPNPNPFANDNVTSTQLQGHTGTIIECSTCHEGDLGNTLGGPHGMHPVGGTSFADGGHEHLAKSQADSCRACHGQDGEGTVLSRAATSRSFVIDECKNGTFCPGGEFENFTVHLAKGEAVTCTMCHSNEL